MTGYPSITRLRRTLFWVFAGIFLLTWPPLLFYTLGIAPARGTDQLLTETGAIRVESRPTDARVTFDGELLDDTTPTVLDRIAPGTHQLLIEKADHEPWRGIIEVTPRAVVRITPAVLPRQVSGTGRMLSRLPVRDVALAAEGQYIGLVADTVGQISVINAEEESSIPIGEELLSYADYLVSRVGAQEHTNRFYVWAQNGRNNVLLVLEAGSQGSSLEATTTNPILVAASVVYQPTLSGALFVHSDDRIVKLDDWGSTDGEQLAPEVVSSKIIEGTFYYLTEAGEVGRITSVGRHDKLFTIPGNPFGQVPLGGTAEAPRARIVHATDEWIAYATDDGITVGERGGSRSYGKLVGARADQDRERLIVWSQRRFGMLPYPSSGGSTKSWTVTWFGSGHASDAIVDEVYAVAGGTHVMYERDSAVWLQPVLPHVQADPNRVLELKQEARFWFAEGSGKVVWPTAGGIAIEKVVADQPLIMLE